MKNVAGTSYFLRTSRISGVYSGFGPSSKVSTICLSGTETVVVVVPSVWMIGPPSSASLGT